MNAFSRILHCDGCTDRLTYQRNIALLAAAQAAVQIVTMAIVPGVDPGTMAMAWLNPFVLIEPWIGGSMPFAICVGAFFFFAGISWNSVHRLRHAGLHHGLGLVAAVPFVGLPMAIVLALLPAKKRSVWNIAD